MPSLPSARSHPRLAATLAGALALAACAALAPRASFAAAPPGASTLLLQAGGSPSRRKAERSPPAPAPRAGDAPADKASEKATAAAPSGASGGSTSGLVGIIREYATWILAGLGALLAGVLAWAVLGRRGGGSAEEAFAELGLAEPAPSPPVKRERGSKGGRKFSSTRIRAAEVSSKVQGRVTASEVETDREYALVVDEEALKKPPLPEGAEAPRLTDSQLGRLPRPGDSSSIQRHLENQDFEGAFEEYQRQLATSTAVVIDAKMEKSLGDHFLKSQNLERAQRILEHLVKTASPAEIEAEVYFNLGYIHFMRKAFARSRKYLQRFVETEKNPAYVDRARRILSQIEAPPSRN